MLSSGDRSPETLQSQMRAWGVSSKGAPIRWIFTTIAIGALIFPAIGLCTLEFFKGNGFFAGGGKIFREDFSEE